MRPINSVATCWVAGVQLVEGGQDRHRLDRRAVVLLRPWPWLTLDGEARVSLGRRGVALAEVGEGHVVDERLDRLAGLGGVAAAISSAVIAASRTQLKT